MLLPLTLYLITMQIRFIGYHIPGIARMYALSVLPQLSEDAKKRLRWIDYYHAHEKDAYLTSRYFGIVPKTFYKWLKRFDPKHLLSVEEKSRAPAKRRETTLAPLQEERIIALRKEYMMYGKKKLQVLYEKKFHEPASLWHIQKTITKWHLYPHPAKNTAIQKKRATATRKKQIHALRRKPYPFFLFALDTIVIHAFRLKRYIITAIDTCGKIAYARMYKNHSSFSSRDFLLRLLFLHNHQLFNIQMDNGSEWAGYFREACDMLGITQYYSRVKTPKDNPVNERFNKTLKYEFLFQGNFHEDIDVFNSKLTEWLVEYNFNRPHQSLDYLTPIEYTQKHTKLLPMYPSSTRACKILGNTYNISKFKT